MGAGQRAIEIEFRAGGSAYRGDVNPLVCLEDSGDLDAVPRATGFRDEEVHLLPVAAHIHFQISVPEIEETPGVSKTRPSHPAFDRGLRQRIEYVWRQLHITVIAAQLEDAVWRGLGRQECWQEDQEAGEQMP
jgi:hypothetical protein